MYYRQGISSLACVDIIHQELKGMEKKVIKIVKAPQSQLSHI